MTALHHLIYQSTAVMPFTSSDVSRLLTQSRLHNEEAAISGMLLYDGNRFLQVLEGSAEAVTAVFGRIRLDCRHTDVEVLANGPVAQRQFGNWAMGLINYRAGSEAGFEDLQALLVRVQDTALWLLIRDFQRFAGNSQVPSIS